MSESKGLYNVGKSHAEGGIPAVNTDTGQHIEVELNEYKICNSAYSSNKILRYSNKTNKEILDDIHDNFSCRFNKNEVKNGEFILCKIVVLDPAKRSRKGTVKQLLDEMQSEKSCNVSQGGAILKQGGEIESLISKAILELKFYETTPEHAKEFGIEAKKPLYVQNLCVSENERLKGVGKKVLNYLEDYARKNHNDVIFGYVAKKASFTKDSRQSFFCDINMIKNWLHSNGYAINENNNDFHKVVKSKIQYHLGGDMTKHLAPNGKPSNLNHEQWHLVRTPAFKKWFGDWENDPANASKVVDENGEPLVVYHGSRANFNVFKNGINDWGFYFTNKKLIAKTYGSKVKEFFLNSKIFELVDMKGGSYEENDEFVGNLIESSKNNNRDVFLLNFVDPPNPEDYKKTKPSDVFIVFNPNQIKLADGTNTTFDGNNPDIRFEQGGEISEDDKIYKEWTKLVNMSASELKAFMKTDEGKDAGLDPKEAKRLGIGSGQESAKWILKMKSKSRDKWTLTMWDWAKRQINFINRMRGNKGKLFDENGNKTRKHTSLLIWGHDPMKYEDGGEVGDLTQELTIYKTVASGDTFTEVLYLGLNENDAATEIQDTDSLEEDGKYDVIAEKQTNKYKFVGELDTDIHDSIQDMINDYAIEDYYEDESIWQLIDEGDWETYDSKEKARVNASTDEMIEKVQDYINDKYVHGRYGEKYMEINVYADEDIEEDENLGCIQVRIADHSQNTNNLSKSGCNEHLSIVIANKNATKSRFIPLGRELYFTDSDSFESIISEVENEIEQLIEKVKDSVFKNGGEVKMADGGEVGDSILPIGTKVTITNRFRDRNTYEIVGFLRDREGVGRVYSAYELKADLSATKGKKQEITYPYPTTKTNSKYWAELPKEGAVLLSQSEIDSENRRNSQSEAVLSWEGVKPVYLMTKEEYSKEITPKIKSFNKFIQANKDVFKRRGRYSFIGFDYVDFNTFKENYKPREIIPNSKVFTTAEKDWSDSYSDNDVPKQATPKQIAELNDFLAYFKTVFPDISKIEGDETGNNKRSIRRAIDDGTYEKLLREGKINFTFLKTIFDSVGVNMPTKLEKVEKEVEELGITSVVKEKNINNAAEFTSKLKVFFADAMEYYKKGYINKYIQALNNVNSFYETNKDAKFRTFLDFKQKYLIFNKVDYTAKVNQRTNLIEDYVSKNSDLDLVLELDRSIMDRRFYTENISIKLVPNYVSVLNDLASKYSNNLFETFAERILGSIAPLNNLSKEFPNLKYAYIRSLDINGFLGELDLVYPNGFVLSIETDAILAGGYNIQVLHVRGLIKFKNKGKFMPMDSILKSYSEYDPKLDLAKQTFIAKNSNQKFAKGGEISEAIEGVSKAESARETVDFYDEMEGFNEYGNPLDIDYIERIEGVEPEFYTINGEKRKWSKFGDKSKEHTVGTFIRYDADGNADGILKVIVKGAEKGENKEGLFKIAVKNKGEGIAKKLLDRANKVGIDLVKYMPINSYSTQGRAMATKWLKSKMENGGEANKTYASYKDKYNIKYGYKKGESHSLEEISKDTGVSMEGLQQIYNKGIGAYKTNPESVRPNVNSKEQWAMARVYSAVMGGKASDIDSNELEMELGGQTNEIKMEKGNTKFMQWYFDWYNKISDKINITFSLPNVLQPFKEENVVILDLFEKIDQNIDAKPYFKEIVQKADDYGVTIYLEPMPRYKYFIKNIEKRKKISKDYLVLYYQKFGFELTSDKNFMKRLPKSTIEQYHLGGDMTQHLAPNGKPSNLNHEQWHLVRTPEFKAWFGDWENDPENSSKVVDENGEPKVMYHGSRGDFNIFSNKNPNKLTWTEDGLGFYFTSYAISASAYGTKIIAAFVNSRNIKKSDESEHAYVTNNQLNKLYQEGYDSIYFDGQFTKTNGQRGWKEDELVVFEPNQIKLANGTNTTFDMNNPDIRFEDGGEINETEKSVIDQFEMKYPENIMDVEEGVDYLLSQYSGREMASIQVNRYLSEVNKDGIGKLFLDNHNISSKEQLDKYLSSRQSKARKPIIEERKTISKEFDNIKSDYHVERIIEMAMEQNEQMENRINDLEKMENSKIANLTTIEYEDNGKTVTWGTKNRRGRETVVGKSKNDLIEEVEFLKEMIIIGEIEVKKAKERYENVKDIGSPKMYKQVADALSDLKITERTLHINKEILLPFFQRNLIELEDLDKMENSKIKVGDKVILNETYFGTAIDTEGEVLKLRTIDGEPHAEIYLGENKGGQKLKATIPFSYLSVINNMDGVKESYYLTRKVSPYGMDRAILSLVKNGINSEEFKKDLEIIKNNPNYNTPEKFKREVENEIAEYENWISNKTIELENWVKRGGESMKENPKYKEWSNDIKAHNLLINAANEMIEMENKKETYQIDGVTVELMSDENPDLGSQYTFNVNEVYPKAYHRLVGTVEKSPYDNFYATYMNEMYDSEEEKYFDTFEQAESWVFSKIKKDKAEYELMDAKNKYITAYTDASESYDGFGTKTIEVTKYKNKRGESVRKIKVEEPNLGWQTSRYSSGNRSFMTEEEFNKYKDTLYTIEEEKQPKMKDELIWFTDEALEFVPEHQLPVIKGAKREYQDAIYRINKAVKDMPTTYSTEGIEDKKVYLHYFSPSADWHIVEKDMSASVDGHLQDFGYANLGYGAELGYISIDELKSIKAVNLDLYFEPVRWSSLSGEAINTDINAYKNPYELNRAIEKLIDSRGDERNAYDSKDIEFISYYSGYGGLEKFGSFPDDELKRLKYEYFTPDEVCKKMWALAYKYGYGTVGDSSVFEPSVGTGNFLKYAPKNVIIGANEINKYSAIICQILHPNVNLDLISFERNFIKNNLSIKAKTDSLKKYSLVIGNPPYGSLGGLYITRGEDSYTGASNWTEYFIFRGLDLLHKDGLLIFVVGAEQYNGATMFLDGKNSKIKGKIAEKADLIDAYRLPTNIFERTGVSSEIVIFKKK